VIEEGNIALKLAAVIDLFGTHPCCCYKLRTSSLLAAFGHTFGHILSTHFAHHNTHLLTVPNQVYTQILIKDLRYSW
jgi:hypothetical protein